MTIPISIALFFMFIVGFLCGVFAEYKSCKNQDDEYTITFTAIKNQEQEEK